MSEPNRRAFPPDGKVLVIGMDAGMVYRAQYGRRVYFREADHIQSVDDIPDRAKAVLISSQLTPGDSTRIRN